MSLVKTVLGSALSPFLIRHSIWAAKMLDGRFLSERDWVKVGNNPDDTRYPASKRPFDWTLDLVATGDIKKIAELWLLCPPTKESPLGECAKLPIVEPGTAFQLKVGFLNTTGGTGVDTREDRAAQVIGRVDDKETGECTCFIYDSEMRKLSTPWHSTIYAFGTWRDGIAPLGRLSPDVLGLSLS